MNFVFVPLNGGNPISLDKAILFFGRGSECDVILTNSRKVSRKHCCVAQIDNRIVIRDLGSMNGLRVNDDVIHHERTLKLGDVLWVGDLGFRLESPGGKNQTSSGVSKRVPLPSKKRSVPEINPALLSQDYPVAVPESPTPAEEQRQKKVEMIPEHEIIDLNENVVAEE